MEKTHHNIKAEHSKKNLPGSIYARNGRYWWKVKLPGETKPVARPLVPLGSKLATTDYSAAVECAKILLQNHLFKKDIPLQGDIRTIPDIVRAYMTFTKTYYVDPAGQPTKEIIRIRYALQPLLDKVTGIDAPQSSSPNPADHVPVQNNSTQTIPNIAPSTHN